MTTLAAIRPDEQNLPLLLHVLGAMILVGGLLTGAAALAFARGDAEVLRLGYWSLLAVALPGWILMRIGAQWIYSEQGWDDLPTSRRACVARIGYHRRRRGRAHPARLADHRWYRRAPTERRRGSVLLKATLILSLVLLAAYVVAVWAMAGKPD